MTRVAKRLASTCLTVLAAIALTAIFSPNSLTARAADVSPQLKEIIKLAQTEGRLQIVGTQFGAADGVKLASALSTA